MVATRCERFPDMASRGSANVLPLSVRAVGLDRLQRLRPRVSRLGGSPPPSIVHVQRLRMARFARFGLDAFL